MSRVHDALKKAEQAALLAGGEPGGRAGSTVAGATTLLPPDLLNEVEEIEFRPAPDSHLLSLAVEHHSDGPAEEFRTLRTRMNHLQSLQPIHTIVVTSPSPAEGKSFVEIGRAHV